MRLPSCPIGTFFSRLRQDIRGGVLIYAAFATPALVDVTSLVVDTGIWYGKKCEMQTVVDTAAVAGALEILRSDGVSLVMAATTDATENGYNAGAGDTTIAHAAYEGARYAAIRGAASTSPVTEPQVVTYVQTHTVGINSDNLAVGVSWAPDNGSGSEVSIQVDCTFDSYLSGFLPIGTIELKSVSRLTVS